MSVLSDVEVCVDAGEFLHLTPHLIGMTNQHSSQFEQVYAYDAEWPRIFFHRKSASLNITGLIYEAGAPVSFKAASGDALFAVVDKDLDIFGPAGYVALNDRNLIAPNGVIQLAGNLPGQPVGELNDWIYGDLLPAQYNANRATTVAGFFQAPADGWCMINVIEAGAVTALEVKYTRLGTDYTLSADVESGAVSPQLKIGKLVDSGGNGIPSLGAGQWRISVTGDSANAEIYVGIG